MLYGNSGTQKSKGLAFMIYADYVDLYPIAVKIYHFRVALFPNRNMELNKTKTAIRKC